MQNAGGLKQIVAEEGARGLYRGLGPQFVALLPNWAVRLSLVLHRMLWSLPKCVATSQTGHHTTYAAMCMLCLLDLSVHALFLRWCKVCSAGVLHNL